MAWSLLILDTEGACSYDPGDPYPKEQDMTATPDEVIGLPSSGNRQGR